MVIRKDNEAARTQYNLLRAKSWHWSAWIVDLWLLVSSPSVVARAGKDRAEIENICRSRTTTSGAFRLKLHPSSHICDNVTFSGLFAKHVNCVPSRFWLQCRLYLWYPFCQLLCSLCLLSIRPFDCYLWVLVSKSLCRLSPLSPTHWEEIL